MNVSHLDGRRFRGALIAACDHVQRHRAELNRINVFPVPDGDTGTNLALTAAAIADHLRGNRDRALGRVAREAADAGILGARGNCGMILSHFLLGFAEQVGGRARLTVQEFGEALRGAVEHVYRALERPVEGTMLTVMRATADEAERLGGSDFVVLMERLVERGREALERTPDLLPVLRSAGVVDAGAKGYVHLLEGVAAYVAGDPVAALARPRMFGDGGTDASLPAAHAAYPSAAEAYGFCTEALVRGDALPDQDTVRQRLRGMGDSLVVIRSNELLKVHVHTDEPEAVFAYLRQLGTLAAHKAEDMRAQHRSLERSAAAGHLQLARRPVVVVTDSACDLPDEVVHAHGIHRVPLNLILGDRTLRDGVDITAAEFVERMREGVGTSTSQPAPAAFLDAFARAAEDGEQIVAVILSGALSGTLASAETAAKRTERAPVHLVDSRAASLTQGMLVLRAAELAEQGWTPERIVAELQRIRSQSNILFTLDSFERLLASGRVGRGRALLGTLLDIKPILSLDAEGGVAPVDRVRGRKNVLARMLDLLAARIPEDARRLRFGVLHVDCEGTAREAAAALAARFGERETFVVPATPVIANHTGPGTWGVAYQLED